MDTQAKLHFKVDIEYWLRMVLTHGPDEIIFLLDDVIRGAEKCEEYEKAAEYLKLKKDIEKLSQRIKQPIK